MNVRKLIKEGVKSVKKKRKPVKPGSCPSDEEIASFVSGAVPEMKRERLLSHILSCDTCDLSLKRYLQLLTPDTVSEGRKKVSEAVVSRIKDITENAPSEGLLEIIAELGRDAIRVVNTTGTLLTDLARRRPVPVQAFREIEGKVKERSVIISKPVYDCVVDIKIEMVKEGLVTLTVYLKDRKTQAPSSGERVSLVCGSRELESSLTKEGRVKFANIEPDDYSIQLIRRKEPVYIATVFLKALD
ncbi:MAG: hypothetical protein ISS26_08175 [Candidatus Omnitrophica bacterium]|nr:hypothetical protein [Candidatus Omnitrophota bacterium]